MNVTSLNNHGESRGGEEHPIPFCMTPNMPSHINVAIAYETGAIFKSAPPILPYFDKRKQVTKVTFPVKEQNVSAIYTDVNARP